jgi:hypothetical protein
MGNPDKVAQKDRVFRIESVRISSEEYCDPLYEFRTVEPMLMTDTGYLKLFELVPQDAKLPRFYARWDISEETIDIDACGIPVTEWKTERKGNKGHHTERTEIWSYACHLVAGGRRIFTGTVELTGIWILKHFSMTMRPPQLGLSITVIRTDQKDHE